MRWLAPAVLTLLAPAIAAAERPLLPGDRVEIRCPESASLCVRRTISAAGAIELPGLPPLTIAKLGAERAAARISELLERTGKVVGAHVEVRPVAGSRTTVSVSGLVSRPGEIFVFPETTLQDVLREAGAVPSADLEHVVVQTVEGREVTVDALVAAWRVRPGDRIELSAVARRQEVFVLGGVVKPGAVEFHSGMTVQEAVAAAGGITPHAEPMRIQILHDGWEPRPIDLAADGAVPIRAGDTLQIALREDRRFVAITGAVWKPGQIPYREFMRLTEALGLAGGVAIGGDPERIEIKNLATGEIRQANLLKIRAGKETDPVLRLGDTVVVSRARVRVGK